MTLPRRLIGTPDNDVFSFRLSAEYQPSLVTVDGRGGYNTFKFYGDVNFVDAAFSATSNMQVITLLGHGDQRLVLGDNALTAFPTGIWVSASSARSLYLKVDSWLPLSLHTVGTRGNDTLIGGAGDDSLAGGAGNDSINCDGGGHDTLDGGAGNDTIGGAFDAHPVYAYGGTGNDSFTGYFIGGVQDGGAGDDRFDVGGTANILGGAGNDTVHVGDGLGGTIDGGAGNDSLSADFPFLFIGGSGNDTITDQFYGTAYGGSGDDVIRFGYGSTKVDGGSGADDISVDANGDGHDTVLGGAGNDTITFGGGNSLINAGSGDDKIVVGDTGSDTLTGGGGADQFYLTDRGLLPETITDFVPGIDRLYFSPDGVIPLGALHPRVCQRCAESEKGFRDAAVM